MATEIDTAKRRCAPFFFEAFGHFLVVVVRVTKRALTFNRMVLYQATVECVCGHLEFTSGANAPFFPMGKKRNLGITPLKPIAFFVPLRGQNKGFELFVLCENVCVSVTPRFNWVRTQINTPPHHHTHIYTPIPAHALNLLGHLNV